MTDGEYWSLVSEVLLTGPVDGQQILQYAQTNNVWDALYMASRSSQYAPAWKEAFGQQRVSQHHGSKSVLELAVQVLSNTTSIPKSDQLLEEESLQFSTLLAKFIANCCADNDHNRRSTILAGGLLPLIKSLSAGADPNILVPAIYNVCADSEDPAEQAMSVTAGLNDDLCITLAEERLARTDVPSNAIYSGIIAFLNPTIVLKCDDEIKEYLADLVEMSARPVAAAREDLAGHRYNDFGHPLQRLLAPDGGKLLADHSAACRIDIVRSLLAISTHACTKSFLASSGSIFVVAMLADCNNVGNEYYGDNEEEQNENIAAMDALKTAMLKLVYEVCQLAQFVAPPKYGLARKSLELVSATNNASSFAKSVAYTILYGFVDSNARAHLLLTEDLIPFLIKALQYEREKTVIYSALALATKLAVTWSLRAELKNQGAMPAVKHLLTGIDLGYEIPLNAVTFLELLIKGHPEHVLVMLQHIDGKTTILDDIFHLFDQGHDAICLEVGRLIIEILSTLAQQHSSELEISQLDLDGFVRSCDRITLSRVLVFMGTKAQAADKMVAQRVWFGMGLLSTTLHGREVVLSAMQNSELRARAGEVEAEAESWAGGNVKFMIHNLSNSLPQLESTPSADLDVVMNQMSLG